ncbi:cuticle protein 10.9-like [Varroa jacobsoni]|uniref:cuticle protein 10.9-like n=1 Tax=Varroa jacobsoni TaxID=62625 RepID=UPI000BF4466A|nr:cuticle protein 10.9-like [Varroa jacobsoni]
MHKVTVLVSLLGVVLAGPPGYSGHTQATYGPPSPYEFSYSSQDSEGSHSHSQNSDGRRVHGHYMIQLADGRSRKVEYHADETGFHAKVITNEQGTESKNAADATYHSSAIKGEQAALQYEGQSTKFRGDRSSRGHFSKAYTKWS